MIGCDCATCHSTDPRDRRWRPSVFIETGDGASLLVDAGPDLRAQALAFGVRRVDAILFTHGHADHILGLDEVRRFNALQRRPMACYGDARTLDDVRKVFSYVFDPATPRGGSLPELALFTIAGPFCIGRQEIVPVPIFHGDAADSRAASRRLRLPDRLQPHPRRVVAAARGARRAGARRAPRAAASHAFFAEPGDRGDPAHRPAARLLHAHVPRPRPRSHLAPGCRRGSSWPMMAW